LIENFEDLWRETAPAFAQQRTWARAKELAIGALLTMGRRTVSSMLTTTGQQFVDWTAAYRLFNRERFETNLLLAPARREVIKYLDENQPLVALMDDTLLRKRGRKVSGASWRRDPLGPPFCNNFIWGQRFLEISAALPEKPGVARARAIPINMTHCPSPRKPSKKATEAEWEAYRHAAEISKISRKGAEAVKALREAMDHDGQMHRPLIISADGGFTNSTMIRNLPVRTTLIGRIRKDAKLYDLPTPEQQKGRGRKRIYGSELPTPEEMRKDPTIPWQSVRAFAAGREFDFQIKTTAAVRWRAAGERDLRLVIIRPLGYRLSKASRLLYRNPAYLICTDKALDLSQLLQDYLWRWEIEVNFRDQKTLLGTGQAQVRTPSAVERIPVFLAAAYAYLHLALHRISHSTAEVPLPPCPKWQRPRPNERISTSKALNLFRAEMWGEALNIDNLTHFASQNQLDTKSEKNKFHPANAIVYAST
jgi:hypothetical protein